MVTSRSRKSNGMPSTPTNYPDTKLTKTRNSDRKPAIDGFNNDELRPRSSAEQYWATRALKAEALLSAREVHYREMRTLSYAEEVKRKREVSSIAQQHEERHVGLEKLVMILLGCLVTLVMMIIYLATHYSRQTVAQRSRWSLPSHFTIPILSPFTSVTEHETSVVGTKSLAVLFIASAGLVYMIFRHRLYRTHGK